jgi:hypothetical protein
MAIFLLPLIGFLSFFLCHAGNDEEIANNTKAPLYQEADNAIMAFKHRSLSKEETQHTVKIIGEAVMDEYTTFSKNVLNPIYRGESFDDAIIRHMQKESSHFYERAGKILFKKIITYQLTHKKTPPDIDIKNYLDSLTFHILNGTLDQA